MRLVQIRQNDNGSHNNQTASFPPGYKPRRGWAVIPSGVVTPGFPFGDIEVEEIDGIMTVTKWTEVELPEPEPVPDVPTEEDDINSMLVDHELRLSMLEMGLNDLGGDV